MFLLSFLLLSSYYYSCSFHDRILRFNLHAQRKVTLVVACARLERFLLCGVYAVTILKINSRESPTARAIYWGKTSREASLNFIWNLPWNLLQNPPPGTKIHPKAPAQSWPGCFGENLTFNKKRSASWLLGKFYGSKCSQPKNSPTSAGSRRCNGFASLASQIIAPGTTRDPEVEVLFLRLLNFKGIKAEVLR